MPDHVIFTTLPIHVAHRDAQRAARIQPRDEVGAANGGRPLTIFPIVVSESDDDRCMPLLARKRALANDLLDNATGTIRTNLAIVPEHAARTGED